MRTLLPFFFLVLFACSEPEIERPAGLLTREQFIDVMVDVQLVEAIAKQKMIRNDDPKVKLAEYYGVIFEKHGIADTTFNKTYDWYHGQPDELLSIYDEVLSKLSTLEEELKQNR